MEQPNDESLYNQTSTTGASRTIRHEISLNELVQSITNVGLLSSLRNGDKDNMDPLIAYFYISNLLEPLVVVNHDNQENTVASSSRTVALSNRVIFRILDAAGTAQDAGTELSLLLQKEAALALDQTIDFMARSCLGIGVVTKVAEKMQVERPSLPLWDTDGSFPHFHETLLFQRGVQDWYTKAVSAVQTQRNLVLTTSNRVPIREHHIATWQGAVDDIFRAIQVLREMQQHDEVKNQTTNSLNATAMTRRTKRMMRREVLDCLQQAIRLMEQMRANPDFIDRIDFPLEQYAAIFAPLALPLAIPLLVGLIREWKRYREKQRKKKKSSLAATTATAPSIESSNDDGILKQD
jgi:hypothetical protein